MTWLPAILLGLAGSFHCAGMCGPIVMAIPIGGKSLGAQLGGYSLYHTGRLGGYALLGFLFGVLGFGLNLGGYQQALSLALGVLMLLVIWFPRIIGANALSGRVAMIQSKVTQFMAARLKSNRPGALLGLGFFNGFLPCGLVYVALAASMASFDPFAGAMFMVFFGLGTIPMLLAIGVTGKRLSASARTHLRKAAPILATILALLFIVRGLGLGIPYVSPELGLKVAPTENCAP